MVGIFEVRPLLFDGSTIEQFSHDIGLNIWYARYKCI
nr:MAG TPA: hypothetical protein [Caudoviricetes sp.]